MISCLTDIYNIKILPCWIALYRLLLLLFLLNHPSSLCSDPVLHLSKVTVHRCQNLLTFRQNVCLFFLLKKRKNTTLHLYRIAQLCLFFIILLSSQWLHIPLILLHFSSHFPGVEYYVSYRLFWYIPLCLLIISYLLWSFSPVIAINHILVFCKRILHPHSLLILLNSCIFSSRSLASAKMCHLKIWGGSGP